MLNVSKIAARHPHAPLGMLCVPPAMSNNDDSDNYLFGDEPQNTVANNGDSNSDAANSGAAVPPPPRVARTASGLSRHDSAGIVAMHPAEIVSHSDDNELEARERALYATRAVRKAVHIATKADPDVWHNAVVVLETMLYSVTTNDTTREVVDSLAEIRSSSLAPRVAIVDVDDVIVHDSKCLLPIDGGYGPLRPISGGRMLVESHATEHTVRQISSPPSVVLTFPPSHPHFPIRCARIVLTPTTTGLIRATVYAEGDRREPPQTGVALGPVDGARLLSSQATTCLFAPSKSLELKTVCDKAATWIGLHDVDIGLQIRTTERNEGHSAATYVVPTFLTRALAHMAARNLRLHTVVNAAALGPGGKPLGAALWRRTVALEPATLCPRSVANDDHAFYLRATLHKTYCTCLCRAHAPLIAGGHTSAVACEPCLDIYVCGREFVGGQCPIHLKDTREAGVKGVCVARTSLRMKCVHATDNAPPAVSREYSTYNSLDHELLLAPQEKQIVREIAASAVHMRKCAIADVHRLGAKDETRTPTYLGAERSRLNRTLVTLYDRHEEQERTDTAGTQLVRGVEFFERIPNSSQSTPCLGMLDDLATKMMCAGNVTVEIGKTWHNTNGSFSNRGRLRIQPHIERRRGVGRLWRELSSGKGRTSIASSKHGAEIEYIYGRLFAHRRGPSKRQ